jgi:ADP-ribose pyrophosphatase
VLDPGEDPHESGIRELREEIGMDAKDIQRLGGFYLAPGYTDEYMTVFLARELFNSPLAPDEDEFLNVVCIPIAEAYQQAWAGKIRDGKSLAALFLAQPFIMPS